jgi:hypothetical protein
LRGAAKGNDCMLQILMLTGREVTAVIGMNRQIVVKLGLGDIGADRDIQQLGENTFIDEVAKSIQQNLKGTVRSKS